jgi:transcription factor C subunit 3
MEGDYVHRGIDRQRLFWDIHVVPTKTYDYGNPLQPASTPLSRGPANSLAIWSPLPQPPLPGNHDSNALLPIWSSMDGQNITWPWWYRVLNLVLQPLIFQPGASIEDIHANCDEYTTESFEIELVLQWLVSVNAVKRITGGGYITLPSVWAAFGDVLHDMEDDWLNAHVKQKHEKQQWRDKSHLRYPTLQGRTTQRYSSDNSDESDMQTDDEREAINTSTDIMRHPKEQYATAREQIATATPEPSAADKQACAVEQTAQLAAAAEPEPSEAQKADVTAPPSQDAEMTDANEGHEMDAEGEMDV